MSDIDTAVLALLDAQPLTKRALTDGLIRLGYFARHEESGALVRSLVRLVNSGKVVQAVDGMYWRRDRAIEFIHAEVAKGRVKQ